jgi:hypothetical protein
MVSTEKKFLFIHIPKTGGSSINHLLYPYRDFELSTIHHVPIETFRNWTPTHIFDSLYKFCFVRNPWDLQVSVWRYAVKNVGLTIDFKSYIKWKFVDDTNALDYFNFVDSKEEQEQELIQSAWYLHRTPQIYYMIGESGNIMLDYIGRLETIDSDMEFLSNKLDLDVQFVPRINITNENNESYKDYYDDETRKIIEDRFRMDIEAFGYDFDTNLIPKFDLKLKNGDFIQDILSKKSIRFNLNDLVRAFGDFRTRFENDEDYINQKKHFDQDRQERALEMYRLNLEVIQNKIKQLKYKLAIDSNDDTSMEILNKLILREISYLSQIHKFEKLKNNN